MYRLYHSGTLDHHYTTDTNEYQVLAGRGCQQEGVAWASRDSSAVPVYRLYHEGTRDHHYTKDYNEYQVLADRGWSQEGIAWYSDEAQGVPVYRLYHEGTLNHHYTKDYNEYQVLAGRGWKQEGVAWYGAAEDAALREPHAHHGRVAGLLRSRWLLTIEKERWRIHVSGQCV